MSEVKHTPLPWTFFQDHSYFDMWCVRRADMTAFGEGYHLPSRAEAEDLCNTLNSHGDLVEALRRVEKALSEKKPVLAGIIAKSALSKVLDLGEAL